MEGGSGSSSDLQSPAHAQLSSLIPAFENKPILDFDAVIDGPTSRKDWVGVGKWPTLRTSGAWQPDNDRVGQKVVIAGCSNNNVGSLKITEVQDWASRQITLGGRMASPRYWFHIVKFTMYNHVSNLILATIFTGEKEEKRMFALGSSTGNNSLPETITVEDSGLDGGELHVEADG